MQAETSSTQITFYYENGQTETLSVPLSPAQLGQQLPQMLSQAWLTFQLLDQTVMISTAKIIKVEVKPTLQLDGVAAFSNVQRVTALQRGATGRLGMSH